MAHTNNSNTTRVGAILLAAGRSSRMNAFKPLLPFGDTTVIESCIDYLRVGCADPIVVLIGQRFTVSHSTRHTLRAIWTRGMIIWRCIEMCLAVNRGAGKW